MILGIDAATTKTGYAILTEQKELVKFGVLRTESKEYISRIRELYFEFKKILKENPNISVIVLEDVPINSHNNLKTGKDLAALQGMFLALSFDTNLPIKFYSPSSWRSIIGTYDGTREGMKRDFQKQKAIEIVNKIFNLGFIYNEKETKTKFTDDDKAEAICIAMAYLKETRGDNNGIC